MSRIMIRNLPNLTRKRNPEYMLIHIHEDGLHRDGDPSSFMCGQCEFFFVVQLYPKTNPEGIPLDRDPNPYPSPCT